MDADDRARAQGDGSISLGAAGMGAGMQSTQAGGRRDILSTHHNQE